MMDDLRAAIELRARLRKWFDTPLGRSLQAYESLSLRRVLPQLFGTTALQLGRIGHLDLFDSCIAPTRIALDLLEDRRDRPVYGLPEALPFDDRSIDVALLPHTLDFCSDPHQVLREVARVVSPEGHVVIFGFNPMSLWGLRRVLTLRPRRAPWDGRFFRLTRIKDWLALLDFQVTHGNMLFYRPPLVREGVMERMHFLDKMGDRWWPLMAAVYMVVARKRVAGMTPLPVRFKTRRLIGRAIAEPAARGIVVPFRRKSLG